MKDCHYLSANLKALVISSNTLSVTQIRLSFAADLHLYTSYARYPEGAVIGIPWLWAIHALQGLQA